MNISYNWRINRIDYVKYDNKKPTVWARKEGFMKYIKTLLLAILAGIAIGIGGTIYLTLENKIIGSLMFTVGLYPNSRDILEVSAEVI